SAPGVLIFATFLDNVFRVDFVRAPVWTWVLEWGLFLGACVVGAWLLPRLTTPQILVGAPGVVLLLLGGAAFLFMQKGLWLKVFYPILALLVPLALVVARRLTASEKETRDVVAENLENQKLLGLSFQEKGMLDMALATFAKLPFTNDIKLIYFNLGLDYENRSQRDKAFLVYKKVHDVDPAFEDVARRLERLSQAGASLSLPPPSISGATAPPRPATLPTPAAAARTAAPAPTAGAASGPLAHLVATPIPVGDVPTVVEGSLIRSPSGSPSDEVDADIPTRAGPAPVHHPTPAGGRTGGVSPTLPGGPVGPGGRLGRYEIDRHIGRGGMGDVYLVRDTVIDRKAALKTIRPDSDLSPTQAIEMRQRFYREAQTAGRLTHPNIVTVYDVGEDLGMSYIVMEFVDGETLTRWMKRQRFTVAQIKHVIFHAGMGLDYAHTNGVFHRDVKPDNIMLSKSGLVKVMDFGIARVVESSLTKTGSVIGTPAYMSPEQVHGRKIDARSDIFSLGVILYELLTGQKPFTGETISSLMFAIIKNDPAQPSSVDAKVHTGWDEILGRALAKEPDARYASVRDMAQAVRDAPVS
ncbi:MAG TPA: serine/threonine-protein kinase, partial [Vicinamibacteria bacterium]|nr:serine/threonine-protein kinase [Vicinamibacteria bacterium]